MDIVSSARERYDGHTRNPWNEYECGSYYARAMASFALLQAFSGFRYSAVEKKLFLAPQIKKRPFQIFISTASGWGTLKLEAKRLIIHLVEGTLEIKCVSIQQNGKTKNIEVTLMAATGKALEIRF
jgi:hypothetical protein